MSSKWGIEELLESWKETLEVRICFLYAYTNAYKEQILYIFLALVWASICLSRRCDGFIGCTAQRDMWITQKYIVTHSLYPTGLIWGAGMKIILIFEISLGRCRDLKVSKSERHRLEHAIWSASSECHFFASWKRRVEISGTSDIYLRPNLSIIGAPNTVTLERLV